MIVVVLIIFLLYWRIVGQGKKEEFRKNEREGKRKGSD
jgi:hypothetical protein